MAWLWMHCVYPSSSQHFIVGSYLHPQKMVFGTGIDPYCHRHMWQHGNVSSFLCHRSPKILMFFLCLPCPLPTCVLNLPSLKSLTEARGRVAGGTIAKIMHFDGDIILYMMRIHDFQWRYDRSKWAMARWRNL